MTSPYSEKVNKLNTALENVYVKKADLTDELEDILDGIDSEYQKQNIGVSYANKNVVTNSNGIITTEDKLTIPSASSTRPSADTTSGGSGSSSDFARADHTHPKSSLYAQSSHNHTVLTQMTTVQGSFASTQQRSIFNRPEQGKWTFIDNKISYDGTNITYNSSEIATLDDIPTLLSDLTNDSNFIETSNTTGLIKNDGNIDTNNYVLTTDSRLSDERPPTQHSHELSDINSYSSYNLSIWQDIGDVISVLDGKLVYDSNTDLVTYMNSNGDINELAILDDIQNNIVDNLTTNDTTKSLSARQGKILNDLIGNAITYINQ